MSGTLSAPCTRALRTSCRSKALTHPSLTDPTGSRRAPQLLRRETSTCRHSDRWRYASRSHGDQAQPEGQGRGSTEPPESRAGSVGGSLFYDHDPFESALQEERVRAPLDGPGDGPSAQMQVDRGEGAAFGGFDVERAIRELRQDLEGAQETIHEQQLLIADLQAQLRVQGRLHPPPAAVPVSPPSSSSSEASRNLTLHPGGQDDGPIADTEDGSWVDEFHVHDSRGALMDTIDQELAEETREHGASQRDAAPPWDDLQERPQVDVSRDSGDGPQVSPFEAQAIAASTPRSRRIATPPELDDNAGAGSGSAEGSPLLLTSSWRSRSQSRNAGRPGSNILEQQSRLAYFDRRLSGSFDARFHSASWGATPKDFRILPARIILVRHSQSEGNVDNQAYASVPDSRIPITERGREQAREAGRAIRAELDELFQGKNYQVFFYTSPYKRSLQTYQGMKDAFEPEQLVGWQEEVQLREQDFGNFQDPEGKKREKSERLRFGRFFYRFPNGESGADVYDRVTAFQNGLIRDINAGRFANDCNLVLVTHGLALRIFLMSWFHWTVDQFLRVYNPPNATPIVLERNYYGWDLSPQGTSWIHTKALYSASRASQGLLRGLTDDMCHCSYSMLPCPPSDESEGPQM